MPSSRLNSTGSCKTRVPPASKRIASGVFMGLTPRYRRKAEDGRRKPNREHPPYRRPNSRFRLPTVAFRLSVAHLPQYQPVGRGHVGGPGSVAGGQDRLDLIGSSSTGSRHRSSTRRSSAPSDGKRQLAVIVNTVISSSRLHDADRTRRVVEPPSRARQKEAKSCSPTSASAASFIAPGRGVRRHASIGAG